MNRSARYQHLYREISTDLAKYDSPYEEQELFDDEFRDLNDEALAIMVEELRANLSDKQARLVDGLLAGKSQTDLAHDTGVNQSSIIKMIIGNADYSKGGKKMFGGIVRLVPGILLRSERFRSIIIRMNDKHT